VILSEDGWYYFTASVPAYDGIVLRRAKSLAELPDAEEKYIWHCHESGPMSKHIWAPELHFLFGKWYIYYAGGEKEDIWKIRPYVLECQGSDPMNDPWIEKGKMHRAPEDEFSFEAFSLDATVFENKGKWYYIWAEKVGVGKQISNLYIAEMENGYALKTVQVLLTTPDYDWERIGFWVNEGPGIIKHNGKIFMTYSASETGTCYCVGMLTADENDDLLDPRSWKKERYPVLASCDEKRIYGPGHNSFTKDADGNDIIVYHARTETEIVGDPLYNPNRHAMLMKVRWDADGRPVFSYQ
jgi:GH43 family beta-xylosidase